MQVGEQAFCANTCDGPRDTPISTGGCGIKTLRKLKGIPGLGEAEEDIPVSYTIKESPNREACR